MELPDGPGRDTGPGVRLARGQAALQRPPLHDDRRPLRLHHAAPVVRARPGVEARPDGAGGDRAGAARPRPRHRDRRSGPRRRGAGGGGRRARPGAADDPAGAGQAGRRRGPLPGRRHDQPAAAAGLGRRRDHRLRPPQRARPRSRDRRDRPRAAAGRPLPVARLREAGAPRLAARLLRVSRASSGRRSARCCTATRTRTATSRRRWRAIRARTRWPTRCARPASRPPRSCRRWPASWQSTSPGADADVSQRLPWFFQFSGSKAAMSILPKCFGGVDTTVFAFAASLAW